MTSTPPHDRSNRRDRTPPCLLLTLVAAIGWARAQAPNLTPALALPDAASAEPAAGTQRFAVGAAGATTSLVVFEDTRGGDSDLFGIRVDANGDAVDAVPFAITMAAGEQTAPQVVWNGQAWLVVYLSTYDPGSGYFATQLRALRVAASGQVLDAAPLILGDDDTGMSFAATSNGADWAVAYTGFTGGNSGVRARRVTASGTVLDPGGVGVLTGTFSLVFHLGATFAGGQYLFSWDDGSRRGRRFSPSLTAVDPSPVTLPAAQGQVAGNGAEHLFTWVQQTPAFTYEVVAQRFAGNLVPIDASPVALSSPTLSPSPTDARATWDGSQWLISWVQSASPARATRFSNGVALDYGGIALPSASTGVQYGPSLVPLAGGGALHAWHDARSGTADDVYAVPFTASGLPGNERCLSLGRPAHRDPRIAASGSGYVVTAIAESADSSRVLAWRLDVLGRPIDAQPLVAAAVAHAGLQTGGVAWNGTSFLVVWSDGTSGQVAARRLDPSGVWLDQAPIAVMTGLAPDVSAGGGNFLVTALRAPSFPQYVYSYAARVRGSDGAVLDAPALNVGSSFARRARSTWLGSRWLVATQAHAGMFASQAGVDLQFVDASGTVTPAGSVGVLAIPIAGGHIDIASSPTSALVVAITGSNWTNTDVLIQRILPNGTLSGGLTTLTAASGMGQSRPSVAWNGREYVVTYETLQNNAWFYDREPDVYGVRVAETGVPIDASGTPWWIGPRHDTDVDGDGLLAGRAVFAATTFSPERSAATVEIRLQRSPGLVGFGSGTAGCQGAHGIDASSEPIAGNSTFAITADRGPALGLGVMLVGLAGLPTGVDPGLGVLVHVDLAAPAVLATLLTDAAGAASVSLPLPASPPLYGFDLYVQAAFLWNGPCQPSPSGLSTSGGMWVEVQAP